MVLEQRRLPLRLVEQPAPGPQEGQVQVRVAACALCRTDLHIVDGELTGGTLPIIPGHQVVGTVARAGAGASRFRVGETVGVAWLGWACLTCRYCLAGRENLCERARFTGHSLDGGYAESLVADERFCFRIPDGFTAVEAAPLLCAGLVGYRSLVMAGDAARIGFFGFGASAHLLAQVARSQGRRIYAFTRPGDAAGREFALRLGAVWAGASTEAPPEPLDAAIIFAPAGELVPAALRVVARGGVVVCAGIHMSDIPSFPYRLLWGERSLRSVANLTRADGEAFLELAGRIPLRAEVEVFPLEEANRALEALRSGQIKGSAVLSVGPG
jgi:propanol-preferring alcohol dehydrogenase